MSAGRHRDPNAATGPLRIGRPSRQQLEDRPRWDAPERRHLTRTDDRPATAWDQAAVPAPAAAEDEDQTVRFSLDDLRASTGAHLIPTDLVQWLAQPEPDATGPLPCWHTGEMRTIPAPRTPARGPSRADVVIGSAAFLLLIAAALLTLALAPGGA